jgi:small GTP-binding protein
MTEETKKEEIISFKILLLGDTSVGKTAFILRFCEDKFDEDAFATIGLDHKLKFVKRGGKKIEMHIWDTAGQERFKSIAKSVYKGADGILLVYDMSVYESFKGIIKWIGNIKETLDISKVALVVVGNKCDLPKEEIQVNKEMVEKFEKEENLKIIEASAKENINVNDSFGALLDRMIELGLGKKKGNNDDEDNNTSQLKNEKDNRYRNSSCCGGGKKKK